VFDWASIQERVLEMNRPLSRQELEVIELLMAQDAEREQEPLRRRVAGLIVRLGLRLDPEVTLALPIRVRA